MIFMIDTCNAVNSNVKGVMEDYYWIFLNREYFRSAKLLFILKSVSFGSCKITRIFIINLFKIIMLIILIGWMDRLSR